MAALATTHASRQDVCRRNRRRLMAVSLAVALGCGLAACKKQGNGPVVDPGAGSWKGTVELRSGSVPDPYNWSKVAEIDGDRVTITTHGYTSRDRATAKPLVMSCTVSLTAAQDRALQAKLDQLARMDPVRSGKVGGEVNTVELSRGDSTVRWASIDEDNATEFAAVQAAYDLAARCTPTEVTTPTPAIS